MHPTFFRSQSRKCRRPTVLLPVKSKAQQVRKVGSTSTSQCTWTYPLHIGKAPLQRCGPKGYFQGSRKEFLEGQLPEYKSFKRGNRQVFWYKLYCAWWQRFPWKLSDDEEPPSDNSARMANLAAVAPGEEDQKKHVESRITEVR